MATTTPEPAANGDMPTIGIMGITISESDYRKLLAERRELYELRAAHELLEQKYAVLRSCYQNVHHAYRVLQHEEPEDLEANLRAIDPASAMPFAQFLDELNREFGEK